MKKINRFLWIFVLLLLTVPAGFLILITGKPYTPKEEYPIVLVHGMVGCIVVVGSLGWLTYSLLKKRSRDPLKRAFQVYTFFILAFIAIGSYRYPEAMRKRDRYHFSLYYEPQFKEIFLLEMEAEKDRLPDSVWEHREEISACVLFEMEFNDQVIDQLRNEKNPEYFFVTNPEVQRIKKECMDIYKN